VSSPAQVSRGASTSITASVRSATARSVLVDIEVYDPAGHKVFQNWYDDQTFGAGQTRTYTQAYQVPSSASTGTYSIKVGIFSTHWSGALYSWNDQAGTLTVR